MKKMIAAGFVLLLPLLVLCQQTTFNYPVKQGTKAWDTMTSYAERRAACQIPAKAIARMSTETLLQSIFDYPLLYDLHLFPSFQEGFDNLRTHFYAIDSLLHRPDLAKVYLKVYNSQDPSLVNSKQGPLEVAKHMLTFSFLELLAAQSTLLTQLDATAKTSLARALYNKYEVKNKAADKYGDLGLSTTSWALSHVIDLDAELPAGFKQRGFQLEAKTLNTIRSKAKFIK